MGVRPASTGMLPDVQRLSQFAAAARCNTSSIEAEVDPAGSCKTARREPASEHGAASGIDGSADIAIPDVMLLSGLATLLSPSTSGAASGIGGNAAVAVPDVKRLSQFEAVARCNTSLIEAELDLAGSCKDTRGEPASELGACWRHRRECRARDSRSQTSIGTFHFAVAVDIGDASGIGGNASIVIPDVQLLSGFAVLVAAVDLGVASGIGGDAVIVIPDVKLLSGFFTLPSPSTSGLLAASAGVPLSRSPMSCCYRAEPLCCRRRHRELPAASAGMPTLQFPMSSGYISLPSWLDATPLQ